LVDFGIEILAGELEIIARPVVIIIRLQFLAERPVAVKVPDTAVYINYLPHAADTVGKVEVLGAGVGVPFVLADKLLVGVIV